MQVRAPLISMGWMPKHGYIPYDWHGYNEGMLIYILALGSPTQGVGTNAWTAWTKSYERLVGHVPAARSTSASRRCSDISTRTSGSISAASRTTTCASTASTISRTAVARRTRSAPTRSHNPMGWKLYGENVWGLTASDGPAGTSQDRRTARRARSTTTLRAAPASLTASTTARSRRPPRPRRSPFAPEIVIPADRGDARSALRRRRSIRRTASSTRSTRASRHDVPLQTGHVDPRLRLGRRSITSASTRARSSR